MGKFNFELATKTVAELRNLAKEHSIKGYSKWTKDVLVEELSKVETEIRNAEYKKACQVECNKAKELIGDDFGAFYRLYKNIKGRKLQIDEYDEMVLDYKIISYMAEGNVIDGSLDSLVLWFAQKFYMGQKKTDLSNWTDEQKRTFIKDCLNDVVKSITTESLKKKSVNIMKVSFNDIKFKDNGEIVFDSSKAVKLKAEDLAKLELNEKKAMMRWVATLEDASTRLLQPLGKQIISITMNTNNLDEEDDVLLKKKERLLSEGVKDIATGKHYNFTLQSASGKRKASFLYVDLTKEEVFNLWFELTGTHNREGFYKTFRKNGKVNVSKMNTRLASRVSNSLDIENGFTEEHIKELRGLNVLYIPDAKMEITTTYKTITGPDMIEERTGKRSLKPGDGQVTAKIRTHVLYAKFNRLIDNGEYDLFCHLWEHVAKEDMEKAKENVTLMKILKKVPGVFQLRHGADKGISVWCNYEHIEITLTEETAEMLNKRNLVKTPFVAGQIIHLGDYDMLIPDSVRKYIAGEWKDYPLEICNYLKKKKGWVNLNQQFIDALDLHPSALIKIVDYWIDFALDSLDSIEKTMVFHNIMFDEEIEETDFDPDEEEMSEDEKKNVRNIMPKAIRANALLAKDPQILKWRKAPYDKLVKDMLMGRIKVPGMYTYMVCDPFFIINNVFGVKFPCLQTDENYHNNKNCYVGLFRSPLIAQQNAQKAKVVSREDYWYLKDVIVFNGFDGQWEFMSGADFDGDTCAVIPDDTDFGKVIVDGIVSKPDVYEAGFDGIEVPFDFDDLSAYYKDLARTANPDRTGIITNYAVRSNQIAKHLRGLIAFAKDAGVSTITLLHPREFGMKDHGFYGSDFVPKIRRSEDTIRAKGFVHAKWDKRKREYVFSDNGITGKFSLEQIEEIAESFTNKCEYSSLIVYREIDSAKTSITAEGYAWCMAVLEGGHSEEELNDLNEYTNNMKTVFSSNTFLMRSALKGFSEFDNKEQTDAKLSSFIPNRNRVNSYVSMSALGRAFQRVNDRRKEIAERFSDENDSINLNSYLLKRLTEEEFADLYRPLQTKEHGMQNIIQCLERQRTTYNKAVHNLNLIGNDKQDSQNSIESIKVDEVRFLRRVAKYYNLSLEVVAVASYIATYSRDTKEGLTYAWLLPNTLLSVFRRGDESHISIPVTSTDLCIKDGWLYENGKRRTTVNADDSNFVPVIGGTDRLYAYIKKRADVVVNNNISFVIPENQVYTVKALGFKYHKAGTAQNWLSMVANNNFEIKMNKLGRVCAFVGEESISMIEYGKSFELLDKTVRMINQPTPDKNSIRDIQVVVIG